MKSFEFYNPTRIIFGQHSENALLYELRKTGKRVLFVYGGGSIKKSGLYDVVFRSLLEANCFSVELSGVQPNPRMALVKKGVELAKKNDINFILAVGGGSVIDTAKAIAVGAMTDKDLDELYMNHANVSKALPVGVVLTIPAAGSESSTGSVITLESGFKRSIGGECLIPKFAIMNPERTFTLPAYQTACGASDIIAHLFERYFTPDKDVEFIDRMIEACIKTMLIYTKKAIDEPNDLNSRSQIMWCGTVAHNNLLSTGRTGDWASHDIEHQVSAHNDVAHGEGLSIIFPAWMKYNFEVDKERFVNLATRVFDVEKDQDEDVIIYKMIEKLEAFYTSIGLKTRLSQIGIKEQDLKKIAEEVLTRRDTLGAFNKLNEKQVYEILKIAL